MKIISLFGILIFFNSVNSQKLEWNQIMAPDSARMRYSDRLNANDIKSNEYGVYIAFSGDNYDYFSRQNQFDITYNHLFLAKFDLNGQFLWKKDLGNSYNRFNGIELDNDSVIIYGDFFIQLIINQDTLSSNRIASYIAKLDHEGNTLWIKQSSPYYYSNQVVPLDMTTNENGEIFLLFKNLIRNPFYFDSISFSKPIDSYINTNYLFRFDMYGKQLNRIGFNSYWVDALEGHGKQIKHYNGHIYVLSGYERRWRVSAGVGKTYIQIKKIDYKNNQVTDFLEFSSDNYFEIEGFDISPEGFILIYGSRGNKITINNGKSYIGNNDIRYKSFYAMVNMQGKLIYNSDADTNQLKQYSRGRFNSKDEFILSSYTKYLSDTSHSHTTYPFPNSKYRNVIEKYNLKYQLLSMISFNVYFDNEYSPFSPIFSTFEDNIFLFSKYDNAFDTISNSLLKSGFNYYGEGLILGKINNAYFSKKYNPELPIVNLYPNPAQNYIIIKTNEKIRLDAKIYDIQGRQMQRTVNDSQLNFHSIDLGNLSSGTYILHIKTDNWTKSFKFVKL